jgi:Arc/MetJ-type ribon-helix-helix transcriptional regulator
MGKTIEVEITPEFDAFLQQVIRNGEYATESDAIIALLLDAAKSKESAVVNHREPNDTP